MTIIITHKNGRRNYHIQTILQEFQEELVVNNWILTSCQPHRVNRTDVRKWQKNMDMTKNDDKGDDENDDNKMMMMTVGVKK